MKFKSSNTVFKLSELCEIVFLQIPSFDFFAFKRVFRSCLIRAILIFGSRIWDRKFDDKSVRYLEILTQTPPLDAFHFPRSPFPRWPRIHKGTWAISLIPRLQVQASLWTLQRNGFHINCKITINLHWYAYISAVGNLFESRRFKFNSPK